MSRLRRIARWTLGAVPVAFLALGAVSSGCLGRGEAALGETGEAREAASVGGTCSSNAGCSSNNCAGGACACAPLGGACQSQADCCSNPCVIGGNGAGTCSLCSGYNRYKSPYFGNLHQHTARSLDAYAGGNRTLPAAAYSFAKKTQGQDTIQVGLSGPSVTQTKPLDFLAITDHSEWLDLTEGCAWCTAQYSPFADDTACVDNPAYTSAATCTSKGDTVHQDCSSLTATGTWNNRDCVRNAICGDFQCGTQSMNAWTDSVGAANSAYSACTFTSLVAYEWTGGSSSTSTESGGSTNHRNVIFNTASAANLPSAPYDAYTYNTPPQLWSALDSWSGSNQNGLYSPIACQNAQIPCEAATIPHNTNWSNGVSLQVWSDTPSGVAQQAKNQVSAEIYQHKGSSECFFQQQPVVGTVNLAVNPTPYTVTYPGNTATTNQDPDCDFEYLTFPFVYNASSNPTPQSDQPLNYVRGALEYGIASAATAEKGTQGNPLQLGIVGATDDHDATAGYVDEWSFVGHIGSNDDGAYKRLTDVNNNLQEYGPGGLTGVWAEQNTRDRVFAAIQRRETWATSGPRIQLRFFQTASMLPACQDDFPSGVIANGGVPMGGTFGQGNLFGATYPTFAVQVVADPAGQILPPTPLGATNCTSTTCPGGSYCCSPGDDSGNCTGYPASFPSGISPNQCWGTVPFSKVEVIKAHVVSGNVVEDAPYDLSRYNGTNPDGQTSWCGTWTDAPADGGTFDPTAYAFYYVRVLQEPTYRWSHWDCLEQPSHCPIKDSYGSALPDSVTERAWTSPIWYSPSLSYTVVAGSGTTGNNPPAGNNGTVLQATDPTTKLGGSGSADLGGMAKDAAGNLYVADAGNNVIRRIDPSGWITTFAGNGTMGPGNGIPPPGNPAGASPVPATSVTLGRPVGVAVDSAGNVYFSEYDNNDVRMVDTEGYIWTYATLLGNPTGIAIDGNNGKIYVAMYTRQTIVLLTPNAFPPPPGGAPPIPGNVRWAGQVSFSDYAGDGTCNALLSAAFSNPTGVWVDAFSDVYVNDSGNAVIRKVDTNDCLTLIAGTPGHPGGSGEGVPATSATISSAYGVTTDALGNVFIADTSNNRIRRVDAGTNLIHTVAGSSTTTSFPSVLSGQAANLTLSQPGYAWMDGTGVMYFSDRNAAVYKLAY